MLTIYIYSVILNAFCCFLGVKKMEMIMDKLNMDRLLKRASDGPRGLIMVVTGALIPVLNILLTIYYVIIIAIPNDKLANLFNRMLEESERLEEQKQKEEESDDN